MSPSLRSGHDECAATCADHLRRLHHRSRHRSGVRHRCSAPAAEGWSARSCHRHRRYPAAPSAAPSAARIEVRPGAPGGIPCAVRREAPLAAPPAHRSDDRPTGAPVEPRAGPAARCGRGPARYWGGRRSPRGGLALPRADRTRDNLSRRAWCRPARARAHAPGAPQYSRGPPASPTARPACAAMTAPAVRPCRYRDARFPAARRSDPFRLRPLPGAVASRAPTHRAG